MLIILQSIEDGQVLSYLLKIASGDIILLSTEDMNDHTLLSTEDIAKADILCYLPKTVMRILYYLLKIAKVGTLLSTEHSANAFPYIEDSNGHTLLSTEES